MVTLGKQSRYHRAVCRFSYQIIQDDDVVVSGTLHTDLQTVWSHLSQIGLFFSERLFQLFVTLLPLIVVPTMRILFCSSYAIRLCFKICWTKYVLPLCVGPTTKSENLWRKLNFGQDLVTIDAVTFHVAFVNCRTEQLFLRTHLISSTVCVGRPGSEPKQCLCKIENLALPNHFFHSSPYK